MKRALIKFLLRMLNSQFLNSTPCQYGFIGNVDAFTIEHLRSEESQRPGITVAQVVREAVLFKACPKSSNCLTVIEDGAPRDATVWDVADLRNLGGQKEKC